MTKEDFKARVSMAYEGREQWEAFLNRVWSIHTSELPHWISVADELPHGSVYLFCNANGDVFIASDEIGSLYKDVTHWMALPAPPKKGGDQ